MGLIFEMAQPNGLGLDVTQMGLKAVAWRYSEEKA